MWQLCVNSPVLIKDLGAPILVLELNFIKDRIITLHKPPGVICSANFRLRALNVWFVFEERKPNRWTIKGCQTSENQIITWPLTRRWWKWPSEPRKKRIFQLSGFQLNDFPAHWLGTLAEIENCESRPAAWFLFVVDSCVNETWWCMVMWQSHAFPSICDFHVAVRYQFWLLKSATLCEWRDNSHVWASHL